MRIVRELCGFPKILRCLAGQTHRKNVSTESSNPHYHKVLAILLLDNIISEIMF